MEILGPLNITEIQLSLFLDLFKETDFRGSRALNRVHSAVFYDLPCQ